MSVLEMWLESQMWASFYIDNGMDDFTEDTWTLYNFLFENRKKSLKNIIEY